MATKIGKLKSDAMAAAKKRGHDMVRFDEIGGKAISHCSNCGANVTVNPNPAPNDIDIGGTAVALNCEVTPMIGKATFCIKVIPSQKHPYFIFLDTFSEEEAVKTALELDEVGGEDTFAQVGIFFTDHILHEQAKKTYLQEKE